MRDTMNMTQRGENGNHNRDKDQKRFLSLE